MEKARTKEGTKLRDWFILGLYNSVLSSYEYKGSESDGHGVYEGPVPVLDCKASVKPGNPM